MSDKKIKWSPNSQEYVFVKQTDSKPGKLIVGTFGNNNIVQEFDVGQGSSTSAEIISADNSIAVSSFSSINIGSLWNNGEIIYVDLSNLTGCALSSGASTTTTFSDNSYLIFGYYGGLSSPRFAYNTWTLWQNGDWRDSQTFSDGSVWNKDTKILTVNGTKRKISGNMTPQDFIGEVIVGLSNEFTNIEVNSPTSKIIVNPSSGTWPSFVKIQDSKDSSQYVSFELNRQDVGGNNNVLFRVQNEWNGYQEFLASKDYVDSSISTVVSGSICSLNFDSSTEVLTLTTSGSSFSTTIDIPAQGGNADITITPNDHVLYPEQALLQKHNSNNYISLTRNQTASNNLNVAWRNDDYTWTSVYPSIDYMNLNSDKISSMVFDSGTGVLTIATNRGSFSAAINPSSTGTDLYMHTAWLVDQGSLSDSNYVAGFTFIDSNPAPESSMAYISTVLGNLVNGDDEGVPVSVRVFNSSDTKNYSVITKNSNGQIVIVAQNSGADTMVVMNAVDSIKTYHLGNLSQTINTDRFAIASSISSIYQDGTLGISITSDNGQTTTTTVNISQGLYLHSMTMTASQPDWSIAANNQIWTSSSTPYFTAYDSFIAYLQTLPSSTMACDGTTTIPTVDPNHHVQTNYVSGTNSYALDFTTSSGNAQYQTIMDVPNSSYTGTTTWSNGTDVCSLTTSIVFDSSSIHTTFNEDGNMSSLTLNRYAFTGTFSDNFTPGQDYSGTINAVTYNGSNLVWTITNESGTQVQWAQPMFQGTYVDNVSSIPQTLTSYDQLQNRPFGENHTQLQNRIKRAQSRADSAYSLASAAEVQATAADALATQLELAIYSPIPIPIIAPFGGLQPQIDAIGVTLTGLAGDIAGLDGDVAALEADKIGNVSAAPLGWAPLNINKVGTDVTIGLRTPGYAVGESNGPEYQLNVPDGEPVVLNRHGTGVRRTDIMIEVDGDTISKDNGELNLAESILRGDAEHQTITVGNADGTGIGAGINIIRTGINLMSRFNGGQYCTAALTDSAFTIAHRADAVTKTLSVTGNVVDLGDDTHKKRIAHLESPIYDADAATKHYVDELVQNISLPTDVDRTDSYQSFTAGDDGDGKTEIYIDDTSIRFGYPNDLTQPQIDIEQDHLRIRQGGNGAEIVVPATQNPMQYTGETPIFDSDMQIPNKKYVDDSVSNAVSNIPWDPNTMIVNNPGGTIGVAGGFIIPDNRIQSFQTSTMSTSLSISQAGIQLNSDQIVATNKHIMDTDDSDITQDQQLTTKVYVDDLVSTICVWKVIFSGLFVGVFIVNTSEPPSTANIYSYLGKIGAVSPTTGYPVSTTSDYSGVVWARTSDQTVVITTGGTLVPVEVTSASGLQVTRGNGW